ncbi:hypothetical protein [Paraburkholderia sp. HD33-4]|uniref:hypothetical protein n=1 Tax=Paraburkholderia sp. HD33-4 TaxID=2883242 RepID=UPI001F1EFB04|nr:hypothetical protein [Paraburkholderia sp. HD33-4]
MSAHIFQIFHDDATRQQLDTGFVALDTSDSPSPEWHEYWAIRRFFLTTSVNEGELYGFFGADFAQRTGLSAESVAAFIREHPGQDVYTFSPSQRENACYLNVFEQGNRTNPGLIEAAEAYVRAIPLEVDLRGQPMDKRSAVVGQFIVATPAFWKTWFALTERLFDLFEGDHPDFQRRIASIALGGPRQSARALLVERVASLVLALCPDIGVAAFDASTMPLADAAYRPYAEQIALLEELKAGYAATGDRSALNHFYTLRGAVLSAVEGPKLERAKSGFLGTQLIASPDLLYICLTHVPPPFEFPSDVSMLCLGAEQGPGKANLRDLAPEWEPYHPQIGGLAGCFALKNYIVDNNLQVRQIGICQYRKFVSHRKIGGTPADNYPVMDVVSSNTLTTAQIAEAMAPGRRDFLLGQPAAVRGGYLNQYQECHPPEDLLRFAATALELGVLSRHEATPFMAEQVFLPGGIEMGVFPAEFWVRSISAIESVVRACCERYPIRREGYQARSWAFCAERLGSFLLLRHLTATYGVNGWMHHVAGQLNLLTEEAQTVYVGGQ